LTGRIIFDLEERKKSLTLQVALRADSKSTVVEIKVYGCLQVAAKVSDILLQVAITRLSPVLTLQKNFDFLGVAISPRAKYRLMITNLLQTTTTSCTNFVMESKPKLE
jgi:hypothetical protein